ncbi:MAG: hypothetical protein AAFV62_05670, partial [Pseudomonadota bacterium]
MPSQSLLIPDIVELGAAEIERLLGERDAFE